MPGVRPRDEWFSRVAVAVPAMRRDPPIVHRRLAADNSRDLVGAIRRIEQEMGSLRLPLLALHGLADRITHSDGSAALLRLASSLDRTLRTFSGAYHDLWHAPVAPGAIREVVDWLRARFDSGILAVTTT